MMKKKIFRFFTMVLLSFSLSFSISYQMNAQCPMCKMAAESNLNNGGEAGKGLNNGILYMLATPYVIIGGIAYVWYRNRRKEDEEEEATV